ncbi:LOW QUALITY PROTEIN: uncharacterized protein [Macrobrachium rosenbergii]|uniref:LOW QUALITY PROTEIN: uncharacterized protein n=1 Tax=Macrobrachium rosenbergii TaxID=79674 RepID=UPI0034D3E1C7
MMYPRKLLDLCIENFVRLTKNIQLATISDKEKYMAVKRMWDVLWTLPQNIPIHAGELLHAYLMPSSGQDFSQSFLIALAANLRRITVFQWSGHIPLLQTSTFNDCYGYCQAFQLQALDLAGVDMNFNTSLLEGLLPKCLSLNVLKLGNNVNKAVLALAKQYCPLTVLHITEPQPWKKELSLPTLMELFFDVSKIHPEELLKKIRKGKNPHMKAAWPNLTNLSTGSCDVTDEFFVLAWIVFKKLKYVHSSENNISACMAKYLRLRSKVPDLGPLAIGRYFSLVELIPYSVKELIQVACAIETFTICVSRYLDSDVYKHFERLSEASLCPKAIWLTDLAICQEFERGTFSHFGKRAKKLQLDGGMMEIEELGELLFFPALEELTLNFRYGLSCSSGELPEYFVFPQVTSLVIRPLGKVNAHDQLFQMLPNTRELVLLGTNVKSKKLAINFKILPELRVLNIGDWNLVHLPDVLDVPRDIQYRERFKLYGPSDTLSCEDLRSLLNSGWNYFPRSKSALEAESTDIAHFG